LANRIALKIAGCSCSRSFSVQYAIAPLASWTAEPSAALSPVARCCRVAAPIIEPELYVHKVSSVTPSKRRPFAYRPSPLRMAVRTQAYVRFDQSR
jgi:hypothetical protein